MKQLTFLFSTAALALFCVVTQAAVIIVNTTNNVNPLPLVETSLRQALTNLHDGDTIQFNIPGPGPFYILQPNNARIQIVLDSRDGPEHRTRLGALSNSGFFDWESAILAAQGAKNFKIRGVSFLSRHTVGTGPNPSNQDPGDPEIFCIAL